MLVTVSQSVRPSVAHSVGQSPAAGRRVHRSASPPFSHAGGRLYSKLCLTAELSELFNALPKNTSELSHQELADCSGL